MNLVPTGEVTIPRCPVFLCPGCEMKLERKKSCRIAQAEGGGCSFCTCLFLFIALLFISNSFDFGFKNCFSLHKLDSEIIIWLICLLLLNET